jgi:hypothetical protein
MHKRTHNREKEFECDVCKVGFSHRKHLNWHRKKHLLCHSCGKEIREPQYLKEHFVEDKCTGRYVCNKCNNQFVNFMKLVQHMARQHGNNGNYECGFCQELESIVPTGIGYGCCVCDLVFNSSEELQDHMVIHDIMQPDFDL